MVLWQSVGSFLGHLGSGLDRFDLDGLSGWDGDSYPLNFLVKERWADSMWSVSFLVRGDHTGERCSGGGLTLII